MSPAKLFRVRPGEPLRPETVEEIASGLRNGKIIVFPTDTVYGIGTSALLPEAAKKLFSLKGRDSRKPLPILIDSAKVAGNWVRLSPSAEKLAGRHWPGPLTLVLPPTAQGRRLLSPGAETLALRVPDHPVTRLLLFASGIPWAATSANRSGEPPASDGEQAAEAFLDKADYIVDAGPAGGVASTVVDASGPGLRVLREGALSREDVLAL